MGQYWMSDILEFARECLTQDDLVALIDKLTAMLDPARLESLDAYMAGQDVGLPD